MVASSIRQAVSRLELRNLGNKMSVRQEGHPVLCSVEAKGMVVYVLRSLWYAARARSQLLQPLWHEFKGAE